MCVPCMLTPCASENEWCIVYVGSLVVPSVFVQQTHSTSWCSIYAVSFVVYVAKSMLGMNGGQTADHVAPSLAKLCSRSFIHGSDVTVRQAVQHVV